MSDQNDVRAGSASRAKSCALLALGPVLLVVALVAVFIINNRPPNISVPTPKMPKDNGWDYFVRAGGMIVGVGPLSDVNRQPSSWTVPELRRFASDNAAALTILRQGVTKPYLSPPVRSFGTQSPELARFRELARVTAGQSIYYEATGQYGRAVDSRLDGIELGVTIPREGGLIQGLTGPAVEAISGKGLDPLLPKLSAVELAKAAHRLEGIQAKRVAFADILVEEGCSVAGGLSEMFKDRGYAQSAASPLSWLLGGPSYALASTRLAFANKSTIVRDVLDYYHALAVEQRHNPCGTRSRVPIPRSYLLLPQASMPDFGGARCAMEKSNALATLLQTEVALRRYRLDHGSYPATLSALAPTYLKKTPIDPLGLGKPLKYRQLKGGKSFLLYSLGPNLKDDGGVPGPWQGAFRTGDIVAGKL